MLPAAAMLVVMFLVPLVLFFVRTFAEFDGRLMHQNESNS